MHEVPAVKVPVVVALAFWGGVWGILLGGPIRVARGGGYGAKALAIGALGPSLVAWFVVMPIKGMGFAAGWDSKVIVGALLLNGAWGLGVALLMRLPFFCPAPTKQSIKGVP